MKRFKTFFLILMYLLSFNDFNGTGDNVYRGSKDFNDPYDIGCIEEFWKYHYSIDLNSLYKLLYLAGIDCIDVVLAQVIEETMSLQSGLCKNNFNLFGMKLARVRKTTALGECNGHANYASYLDSICLLYTSPSPRDRQKSRMPSSA